MSRRWMNRAAEVFNHTNNVAGAEDNRHDDDDCGCGNEVEAEDDNWRDDHDCGCGDRAGAENNSNHVWLNKRAGVHACGRNSCRGNDDAAEVEHIRRRRCGCWF